jgi:hypothetical protein
MAQALVYLGSIHGKFNVREAIPHRTTISKKVPEKVQEVKTMVRAAFSNKKYIGLTTDGWKHDMLKVSHITTTVHYFDEDMNLHSSILDTSGIDDRKAAEVIGKQLDDVAAEYGWKNESDNCYYRQCIEYACCMQRSLLPSLLFCTLFKPGGD